jgi:hypothetical protein
LKDLIKVLLLERLSLRGICRVTGVSLTLLLHFITELYCALPDDLCNGPVKLDTKVLFESVSRNDRLDQPAATAPTIVAVELRHC